MNIKTLGVDLGKSGCHVVGQDEYGKEVARKSFTRKAFAEYLANLPSCRVVFEACGGAHYWARKAKELGHDSALIPAQFVKPFVKSNKNDWIDAEAICEADQRPNMRYAHIRSPEQQALGSLLKLREAFVSERTACINRGHAFLLEFGINIERGRGFMGKLGKMVSDPESPIPVMMRQVLNEVHTQYKSLQEQIERLEALLGAVAKSNETMRRIMSIPGIGVMTACSVVAWAGDGKQFVSAREFAAWIGLVPRQYSTGGKTKLLGISKRGNSHLRHCLIHGARSAIQWKVDVPSAWSGWVKNLLARKPKTVAIVAMANKLARILWAVLTGNDGYQTRAAVA